jgi:glycerophosphoryl diester phosphodiesterase
MAEGRHLAIAHRAGNDPATLRAAEAAGADYIELDLWPFRGRLEVRHWKTIGPIPIYWERWRLAPRGITFPSIEEVLSAAAPETRLMFDLKGGSPRVAEWLLAALRAKGRARRYAVCSQWWRMLEPFHAEEGALVWYSAGSERALRRLLERLRKRPADGVSAHRKLLDAQTVAALHELVPIVVTWPVDDAATLERLAAMGVDGFISEQPEVLALVRGLDSAVSRT